MVYRTPGIKYTDTLLTLFLTESQGDKEHMLWNWQFKRTDTNTLCKLMQWLSRLRSSNSSAHQHSAPLSLTSSTVKQIYLNHVTTTIYLTDDSLNSSDWAWRSHILTTRPVPPARILSAAGWKVRLPMGLSVWGRLDTGVVRLVSLCRSSGICQTHTDPLLPPVARRLEWNGENDRSVVATLTLGNLVNRPADVSGRILTQPVNRGQNYKLWIPATGFRQHGVLDTSMNVYIKALSI